MERAPAVGMTAQYRAIGRGPKAASTAQELTDGRHPRTPSHVRCHPRDHIATNNALDAFDVDFTEARVIPTAGPDNIISINTVGTASSAWSQIPWAAKSSVSRNSAASDTSMSWLGQNKRAYVNVLWKTVLGWLKTIDWIAIPSVASGGPSAFSTTVVC